MANTYSPIATQTLSSSAASVTFSNIPSTFQDLVVRFSARLDTSTTDSTIKMFTNISASVYSAFTYRGTGSTADSSFHSNFTTWQKNTINAATSASTTFTNAELYIPNYLSSLSKAPYYFQAMEDNSTQAYLMATGFLVDSSTAINSLTFETYSPNNFVAGSSFDLYGIA